MPRADNTAQFKKLSLWGQTPGYNYNSTTHPTTIQATIYGGQGTYTILQAAPVLVESYCGGDRSYCVHHNMSIMSTSYSMVPAYTHRHYRPTTTYYDITWYSNNNTLINMFTCSHLFLPVYMQINNISGVENGKNNCQVIMVSSLHNTYMHNNNNIISNDNPTPDPNPIPNLIPNPSPNHNHIPFPNRT